MKQVAIVGTGIAGMSAAARLAPEVSLILYERNAYVGGHTHTVTVSQPGESVPVDTGFMVYNEVTYPRLTRLFADLGVETMPTDMSFGVHHRARNLYWGSRMPFGLFAQARNLVRPDFWRMLRDLGAFNRRAAAILDDPSWEDRTMAEFVDELGLSRVFLDLYLLPMIAAIWSSPHDLMLEFPAVTMIRFLHNHGLLGVTTQHPWRTVKGGSQEYREKLIAPFRDQIHTECAAVSIEPDNSGPGAIVTDVKGRRFHYDAVLIATHADEARALLKHPTPDENQLLGAFSYSRNEVVLHTDPSVMPPRRRAWTSWNYEIHETGDSIAASTHYWMNLLQRVSDRRDYFVSVNPRPGAIAPEHVSWSSIYHHPNFDLASARAQRELPRLNAKGPLYFAGSYFRYGFHEDALMAGQDAAESLLSHLHASTEILSL
jgi:predicted NAD/FAD-binding protein